MVPNVNDPHLHSNSLSLISSDSCTPELVGWLFVLGLTAL